MNIIQHHEPIDFEALFNQLKDAYIGIDKRDWEVFSADADEIHSFHGSAEWKDRVNNALGNDIGSDEAVEIINKCKTFMLIIRYNPDGERPVKMNEISAINEFVSGLPEESDIQWKVTVITQNGDDYHTRAGSSKVIYLHGEALKNTSSANPYNPLPIDLDNPDIHIGDKAPDGSQIRPFVIYFDENIDKRLWQKAVKATKEADYFVVVGSTMLVFPAADLIRKISADCRLIVIDPGEVSLPDGCKHQYIHLKYGASKGMQELVKML